MTYVMLGGVISLGLGGWAYLRRRRRGPSTKHDHTETVGYEFLEKPFPEDGDA